MNCPPRTACSPSTFEDMYRQSRDPWNFSGSEYERARYRATLDALLRRSYRAVCGDATPFPKRSALFSRFEPALPCISER